jgi:hypothetical protein
MDIVSEAILIEDENFALFPEKMTISWFDENGIFFSPKDQIFTIYLKAKSSGVLSDFIDINSSITTSEIYLDGDQIFQPVLNFDYGPDQEGLKIISCSPNPWTDESTLTIFVPKPDLLTISFLDLNGKLLKSQQQYFEAGYHRITISSTDVPDHGVFLIHVISDHSMVVCKSIHVK